MPSAVLLLQVLSCNGTRIINLAHLAQVVTSCTSDYITFEADYNEVIVINRQQAAAGTHTVLQDHSIPNAMSADIQQTLNTTWPPVSEAAEAGEAEAAAAGEAAAAVAAAG